MSLENQKYDAFISYRHNEFDMFIAETLHKELEKFKLPKSLVKENKMEKTRIERVFRDRDELPLANDLNNPLYNALLNSGFLLVICTPRLPESEWCKKEIQTFIELHGKERIFLVLAEGEPEESFPEELLYIDEEITDENGNVQMVRKHVEPLAADVRGNNPKEIKKKIKEEVLRMAAPMFGVNYDDIKQRHREQKIRNTLVISLVCSGIFLCIGAYSIATGLQIRQQAKQIEKQNQEITDLMTNLELEYEKTQTHYALSISDTAQTMLNNGQRMEALYLARNVMPDEGTNQGLPYVAEAENVLSNALYVYEEGDIFQPVSEITIDAEINKIFCTEDNKYIFILDKTDRVSIYNSGTDSIIYQTPKIREPYYGVAGNSFIYSTDDGMYQFNLNTNQETLIGDDHTFFNFSSKDYKYYIYTRDGLSTEALVYCADSKDDHVLFELNLPEMDKTVFTRVKGCFDDENRTLVLAVEDKNDIKLYLIDVATGNVLNTISYKNSKEFLINYEISYWNGYYYFKIADVDSVSLNGETETVISKYDGSTLEPVWEKSYPSYLSTYKISSYDGKDYIYGIVYNHVYYIDASNGELLMDYNAGKTLGNQIYLLETGVLFGIYSEGDFFIIYPDNAELFEFTEFIDNNPDECDYFVLGKGELYYVPKKSRNVIHYEMRSGRRQEILWDSSESIDAIYNNLGTLYYVKEGGKLSLYETESNKLRCSVPCSDIDIAKFIGDGEEEFAICINENNSRGWKVYSSENGKMLKQYIVEGLQDGFNSNGTIITFQSYEIDPLDATKASRRKIAYDVKTGKQIGSQPTKGLFDNALTFFSDDMTKIACINPYDQMVYMFNGNEEEYYTKKLFPGITSSNVLLSSDGKYLAVPDSGTKVYIYDTTNLEKVEEVDCRLTKYSAKFEYIKEINAYVLGGSNTVVFLNDTMKQVGSMKYYLGYDKERKMLIQKGKNSIYAYPFYSTEMIIEEADEVLGGYELPEYLKKYDTK